MDSAKPQLTELLQRFAEGDRSLAEVILQEILPRLHSIASRQISGERAGLPLSTNELINEAWISNLHKGRWKIENRNQFYAIAANAMRFVLVDAARKRLAWSRGKGAHHQSLDEIPVEPKSSDRVSPETILEIDRIMNELEVKDPALARIIEMQYFCGFTLEEISSETGLTVSQVRYLWEKGKQQLAKKLKAYSR